MNDYDVYVFRGGKEVFLRRVKAPSAADASLLVETNWPCAIRGKSLGKYKGSRVLVDQAGTVDYGYGISVKADEMTQDLNAQSRR